MEILARVLIDYGAAGLIVLVLVYILLKGEFVFRFPRRKRKG